MDGDLKTKVQKVSLFSVLRNKPTCFLRGFFLTNPSLLSALTVTGWEMSVWENEIVQDAPR